MLVNGFTTKSLEGPFEKTRLILSSHLSSIPMVRENGFASELDFSLTGRITHRADWFTGKYPKAAIWRLSGGFYFQMGW